MGKWKAPPGWAALRQEVFRVKGRRCHWCGGDAGTVDHLRAVALGGTHELANLVPACQRCNFRRGAVLGNKLRGMRVRPARDLAPYTPSREW